jgi:hypothetical protein
MIVSSCPAPHPQAPQRYVLMIERERAWHGAAAFATPGDLPMEMRMLAGVLPLPLPLVTAKKRGGDEIYSYTNDFSICATANSPDLP